MISERAEATRIPAAGSPESTRRAVSDTDGQAFERISDRLAEQRRAADETGRDPDPSPLVPRAQADGAGELPADPASLAALRPWAGGLGGDGGFAQPATDLREAAARGDDAFGLRESDDDAGLQTLPTAAQLGLLTAGMPTWPTAAPSGLIGAPDAGVTDQRAALAQLSAYVERLLIEASPRDDRRQAALIKLSDDVFVDTSLSLSRHEHGGWLLRISTADERLLRDMDGCRAALSERFALRGLGDLSVELA